MEDTEGEMPNRAVGRNLRSKEQKEF